MATDFFQQQDLARRHTGRLVFLFILAVLSLIALTYLLVVFVFHFLSESNDTDWSLWNVPLFAAVAAGVTLVVGASSLFKTAELASGGKTVALMLGGREVQGNTRELRERRLLNIVEEMALASGVPTPPVFVLYEEAGINAFAAGFSPGDAVVAVSQGSLNYLTRDELQGVVAHEFSHILNGDMRLNIRLAGLIFGILVLSVIGRILMQAASTGSSSSSKKSDGRGAMVMIGLGLFILGLAGSFFGSLIQAAVSRQREYLADASAVQFTRNPSGIAGALKKIGGLAEGSAITNAKAAEVSHMFFSDAFLGHRLASAFATHPPLVERIKRIDPNFDGNFPEVTPVEVSAQDVRRAPAPRRAATDLPGMPRLPFPSVIIPTEAASSRIAQITSQTIEHAQGLHADVPEELAAAASEPFSARALVYGLLLDPRAEVREHQLAALKANADAAEYEETVRLAAAVHQLPDELRLPLVDLALPALRQLSRAQYQSFRARVEQLVSADDRLNLFEYVLRSVLEHQLDKDQLRRRPHLRYQDAGQVAPQVAQVLALLAWAGQSDPDEAQRAYIAGLHVYLDKYHDTYPLRPRDQSTLAGFDAALQTLTEASPAIKRRMINACAACVLADRQVTAREAELFRAICEVLDCPVPPLAPAGGPVQGETFDR